jgi:hypothetical protein
LSNRELYLVRYFTYRAVHTSRRHDYTPRVLSASRHPCEISNRRFVSLSFLFKYSNPLKWTNWWHLTISIRLIPPILGWVYCDVEIFTMWL